MFNFARLAERPVVISFILAALFIALYIGLCLFQDNKPILNDAIRLLLASFAIVSSFDVLIIIATKKIDDSSIGLQIRRTIGTVALRMRNNAPADRIRITPQRITDGEGFVARL